MGARSLLAAAIPSAFANLSLMEADLSALMANTTNVDRNLVDMMGASITAINGYGCWCYFEESHGKGRSQPVNDIDGFCQILHNGYDCVMMDAELEGDDECIPWEVDYNSAPQSFDDLTPECERRNEGMPGGNCAVRACIVEGFFVASVF